MPNDPEERPPIDDARGRLDEQLNAMERELDRLGLAGEEVPPVAREMLARLRELTHALGQLEDSLRQEPPGGA